MKKISIILLFFVGLFVHSACNEDTVNIDPIGYTEAGFFQGDSDFQWAINGIYHSLGGYYAFLGDPNRALLAMSMLPSDDLTTRANWGEENFVALQGGMERVSRFYHQSYRMIQRCNTVLQYINERGETAYVDQQLKNYHKGEALFMRSWVNIMLWNAFETAPLITERIALLDGSEFPSNSTGTQLLDQAITDLAEAANLLPVSWPSASLGRVTKNSAHGLRGKALVFRGTVSGNMADFSAAITDFNAIAGRSLVPNYANNFVVEHENNSESLFEYQANNSLGNANPFVERDNFAVIGEMGVYWGVLSARPNWANERWLAGTQSLYNAYEETDPRRSAVFLSNAVFDGTNPNINKYVQGPFVQGPQGPGTGMYVNNPRILRLADVMLLHAEAIIRTGGDLNQALALINAIRTRARNSVSPASEEPANRVMADAATMLEWVFEERRLELAVEEGHRWWDLRRRHIAGEIDIKDLDFSSINTDLNFQDHNIRYPLPNSEIIQNPNLNQNVNY
jgi:starch-binding outer membrane protein, SusD/RagB family